MQVPTRAFPWLVTGLATAITSFVGCRTSEPAPPSSAPPAFAPQPAPAAVLPLGGVLRIGGVTVESSPLPQRFRAPLPATEADLQTLDRFPPTSEIAFVLAAGDAARRAEVLAAWSRGAVNGSRPKAVDDFWGALLPYGGPDQCAWLATVVADPAQASAHALAWQGLATCDDDALAPVFARDDAPDQAVVSWLLEQSTAEQLPFSPRIARAAATVARSAKDAWAMRPIGFVFARMRGLESVAALRELQQTIADPKLRAMAALGMLRHDTPEGRALGVASCQQPGFASDPMCTATHSSSPPPVSAADLPACVRSAHTPGERAHCLALLAATDRARAVTLARALDVAPSEPGALATLVRTLVRFPEAGALEQHLDALGLTALSKPSAVPADPPALTVLDHLILRGRATQFDTETDQFPNGHDRLLLDLAALTGTVLSFPEVRFEELPPNEGQIQHGVYTLRAYMDDRRYTVHARDLGDWYDLRAVLELLNVLLQQRHSEVRVELAPTGDQTAIALALPQTTHNALVAAGLLEVERPEAGMDDGQAFEQELLGTRPAEE